MKDKLKSLELEFLPGVPVHLTDEMVDNIKVVFLDTIEKAKPPKQDTDRGRHALNMAANGWNNGISTFEARLKKEIGK